MASETDILTRYALDPSGFVSGADTVVRATRRIEDEERRVARAIEDFAQRTERRKTEFYKLNAEQQIAISDRVRREQEADQRRLDQLIQDSQRRRTRIAQDEAAKQVAIAEAAARKEADAARRKAEAEQEANRKKKDAADAAAASTRNMLIGMTGFGSATAAIGTITSAFRSLESVVDSAFDRMESGLELLRNEKENIRGLAVMLGNQGATADFTRQQLQFRAATGFTTSEAEAFVTEYQSTGGAGKGVNISEAEFDKSVELLGRLVKSQGGGTENAAALSSLAGIMVRTRQYDTGADIAAETLDTLKVLQFGRGADSVLIKELATVYGGLVDQGGANLIKDPQELAAYIAAASIKNPKEASTVMNQATRVLINADGPWKGMLDEAGIKEGQNFRERFQRLFQRMEQAERSGQKVTEFLISSGVYAEAAIGLGVLYQQRGFIDQMLGPTGPAGRKTSAQEAVQTIEDRYNKDAGLKLAVQDARKEANQMIAAEGRTEYAVARAKAEADLTAQGGVLTGDQGEWASWLTGMTAGAWLRGKSATEEGRRLLIDREMRRQVAEVTGERVGTGTEGNWWSMALSPLSGGITSLFPNLGEAIGTKTQGYADSVSEQIRASGGTGMLDTTTKAQGDQMIDLLSIIAGNVLQNATSVSSAPNLRPPPPGVRR